MPDAGTFPWLAPNQHLKPFIERDDRIARWWDRRTRDLWRLMRPATTAPLLVGQAAIVRHTVAREPALAAASDGQLADMADEARATLRARGLGTGPLSEAFALVREATRRELGLLHYPVQIVAAQTMVRGQVVEMATGEGKSLTAVLAAAAAALAGFSVHVVTVNDYLATRDATDLGAIYRRLGLTVGLVVHGQSDAERAAAYRCDVVYCTNKELTFDYLRDRIALGDRRSPARLQLFRRGRPSGPPARVVQRGLSFAIVDEIDSILIDEARTPLIISRADDTVLSKEDCRQALKLAAGLVAGVDFIIDRSRRLARLTAAGEEALQRCEGDFSGVWRLARARRSLIEQALGALNLFELDEHYIIIEDKVQIVDEFTGRTMADRQWTVGLHQLIEVKHDLEPSGVRTTAAQMTYQRFFRRYVRLTGMTGTASEVARELKQVYDLDVVRLPTHRPPRRRRETTRVLATAPEKWDAVIADVKAKTALGRPVLIGTRSVAASEALSDKLRQAGLAHTMLTARHDGDEAGAIAGAGQVARVTVATNMAGRGTDIKLAPEARAAGGLHVILTEFHESARIDRQLYGRAARQGDPGSCVAIVALDDDLFARRAGRMSGLLRAAGAGRGGWWLALPALALKALSQAGAERQGRATRRQAFLGAEDIDKQLAFGTTGE